jgi:hypothetical protein
MTNLGPWHTEDFDTLSWHDVHVHGVRLGAFNPDEGEADLFLDIDYILNWEKIEDEFRFTVCRAELVFHSAFRLKMTLDYATRTAGMCPFSIDGIEREFLSFPTGFTSFRWRIPINFPVGSIEFEAPRFTQTLTGKPVVQSRQSLSSEQR